MRAVATDITQEDWRWAPHCPAGINDPIAFGQELFSGLGQWAKRLRIPTDNLRLWIDGSLQPKPYDGQNAAWQIDWEDGPENWAILLLHGQSYGEHSNFESLDHTVYFLEPADRTILGMARL